jgi:cell growth-regulating nucleolar protein
VTRLLNQIVDFDNIPRKRVKFVNFVQNAIGKRTPTAVIDKTWDVFEEALKNPSSAKDAANPTSQTESSGNEEKESNKEKIGEDNQG